MVLLGLCPTVAHREAPLLAADTRGCALRVHVGELCGRHLLRGGVGGGVGRFVRRRLRLRSSTTSQCAKC